MQHLPQVPLPFLQDKIPHAIVFAVLSVLAYRAFVHQSYLKRLALSPGISAFLFCLFYGALDELHQYYVPGRTMDLWDLFADVVGAAIGIAIFRFIQKRKQRTDQGPGVL